VSHWRTRGSGDTNRGARSRQMNVATGDNILLRNCKFRRAKMAAVGLRHVVAKAMAQPSILPYGRDGFAINSGHDMSWPYSEEERRICATSTRLD
jgi:hypothetical protein